MRPVMCRLSALLLLMLALGSTTASRDVLYASATAQRSQPRLPIAMIQESPATDQRPSIRLTFPSAHSYWQVAPDSFNLRKFSLHFETHGFRIPRDGFLVITGVRIQGEYIHVHPFTVVDMSGLEPGSQFWSFQLWKWGRFSHELVAQTSLHIEIVVPQIQPAPYWMHALTPRERQPLVIANLPAAASLRNRSSLFTSSEQAPLPVCFVTGASSVVDGQKMIWLNVMRELSQRPERYKLAVKTFETVNEQAPWVKSVRDLGVDVDGQPLLVSAEEAMRYNVTVNGQSSDAVMLASIEQAFPELLNASVTQEALWPESNNTDRLDTIQPPFMATVWKNMINNLRSCRGGVLSFANSRTVNDRVTLYAARLAGVRAVVVELPNLYPMPIAVDVLLAPSHFALNHPSVASARAAARQSYVCNGGVDADLFSPASLFSREEPRRSTTEFVVGYVGRLATEKSVGMLIEAAKYLKEECSICRIRIIGNGPLKPQLMELAETWRVFPGIVEFIDGVYHDQKALVDQLRRMDVYASTCMFETLGLAPLEAMSVGIPVVGFASGGVGEYLLDGYNGVAVQDPTPQSLSQAILTLYKNETLRKVLSGNARRTVVQRFSQQQGIQKYADLYDRLVN